MIGKQIYVNLPIKNLKNTMEFFSKLGFEYNKQFTDEKAACMIIGENIFAMLLDEKFFKTFIDKQIVDAKKSTEVLIAINVDTRKTVDGLVAKAVAAGGRAHGNPQDHGFMYMHAFEDLDGHIWELLSYEEKK